MALAINHAVAATASASPPPAHKPFARAHSFVLANDPAPQPRHAVQEAVQEVAAHAMACNGTHKELSCICHILSVAFCTF